MVQVAVQNQLEEEPPLNLFGTDKDKIHDSLGRILDVEISKFLTKDEDKSLDPVFDLYFNTAKILGGKDAEKTLRQDLDSIGKDNVIAYTRLRNIQSLMPIIAAIWADRDRPDDARNNGYNIETVVEMAASAGMSYDGLMLSLEDSAIWKSITPHPTETLNAAGINYFCELIAAGELPETERAETVHNILNKMLHEDITPQRKANTFEETDSAIDQAIVYRKGQREFFTRLKTAIEKNYGEKYEISDLEERMPNIALHLWQGGADTDGKLNADRWARLYGMTSITRAAARDHLNDIRAAKEAASKDEKLTEQFNALSGKYDILEAELNILNKRYKELEDQFVEIDAKGVKTLKKDADYTAVKQQYEQLTISLQINNGPPFKSSDEYFNDLLKRFGRLSDETDNPEAKAILQESKYILSNYGIAIAKLEGRHNGKEYAKIMDNLFSDEEFRKEVKNACGIWPAKKKFSELGVAKRVSMLNMIARDMSPEQIVSALYRANPLELEKGTDLPLQTHEFLQLFDLAKIEPQKFGQLALISEADSGVSSEYQNFIMNAFGLKNFIHTPLNEDYENARNVPKNLTDYHKKSGSANALARVFSSVKGSPVRNLCQAIMIFCSDATKEFGRAATYLQAEGIRDSVKEAIGMGIAVLVKIGNGLALERCGGDPMMYGRYIAEVVRDYAEKRHAAGNPLNPKKSPADRAIISMASFFSHTEQGRATRFYNATPKQAQQGMSQQIGEMLGRRMEIMGLVKKGYFIPIPDTFSDRMRKFLHEQAHSAMNYYNSVRHAVINPGKEESPLTDSWSKKILGKMKALMPFANNSARAASKESGGKAKGLTDERAIGNQRTNIIMRTHHDGFFGCGRMMRNVQNAYKTGEITAGDVENFAVDSAWWRRQFFTRGSAASIRADLADGFKKMDAAEGTYKLDPGRWTFDRCMLIGSMCEIEKQGDEFVFSYQPPKKWDGEGEVPEDPVTPEEAYQAMLVYDKACYVALTEAALSFKDRRSYHPTGWSDECVIESTFDQPLSELVAKVRPKDNSVNVVMGKLISERQPWLAGILKHEQNALADKVLVEYAADNFASLTEEEKRLVMANVFSATHPSTGILLGRTEYGYLQRPEPENALANKPFQQMVFTRRAVANDNGYEHNGSASPAPAIS